MEDFKTVYQSDGAKFFLSLNCMEWCRTLKEKKIKNIDKKRDFSFFKKEEAEPNNWVIISTKRSSTQSKLKQLRKEKNPESELSI